MPAEQTNTINQSDTNLQILNGPLLNPSKANESLLVNSIYPLSRLGNLSRIFLAEKRHYNKDMPLCESLRHYQTPLNPNVKTSIIKKFTFFLKNDALLSKNDLNFICRALKENIFIYDIVNNGWNKDEIMSESYDIYEIVEEAKDEMDGVQNCYRHYFNSECSGYNKNVGAICWENPEMKNIINKNIGVISFHKFSKKEFFRLIENAIANENPESCQIVSINEFLNYKLNSDAANNTQANTTLGATVGGAVGLLLGSAANAFFNGK